jgi:hypothetical protein
MSKTIRILSLLGCVCFLGLPLLSQVNTGRILGTVTDQSGGVIAGATVTVTNSETNVGRTLTTDEAGVYTAPNLNPGTYTVRVTSTGFQTLVRQNIALGVGVDARVDVQLSPGQVTQTIEVTAASPMVDTTSAVVSGTLDTKTIVNLPLNGRSFQSLLQLRPGVVASPGGGSDTMATNGLQPQANNYFYEGLDGNDPFTGQSITNTTLPFGDAATILPIDAIQEVNVETNAPAEFGRRAGPVFNIGIKSGTNTIHGSAYAFGRDGAWDARDFVNPPSTTPPPPVELEQWGATVGGPVVKNKLFYFAGFERQSYSVGNAFSINVPTSASIGNPKQSIPDAEGALSTAGIPLSPLSLKLLPLYGTNTGASSAASNGFPDIFAINNGIGKMDYHLNDHHTITGAFFYGRGDATGEDGARTQAYFDTAGAVRAKFLTTSWTWIPNSTWVNDLRFGWNTYDKNSTVADVNTPASSYGINTGVTNPQLGGMPVIAVSGFTQLGADVDSPKRFGPSSDYDLVDHISFLHGKHAFKFGGEFHDYVANLDWVLKGRGDITFTGGNVVNGLTLTPLESFLAGTPSQALLLEGNPARRFTESDYSGFFEDSWRATQRLTVNMGLRYEYFTPISEVNSLIGSWSPQVGFEQDGVNIKSPYNADPKGVAPRLGVAWDLSGKGTTVLRGGAGLYYQEIISLNMVGDTSLPGGAPGLSSIPTAFTTYLPNGATQAPLNATNGIASTTVTLQGANLNWTLAGPVFPASSTSGFVCGNGLTPVNPVAGAPAKNPSPCSIMFTSPNMPTPRVISWNLGIQHAFTPTLSMEADYIGNHGSDMPAIANINQLNPNSPAEIACSHCESITDLPFYSQFPYLQYIDEMTDTAISNYDALQATLTARNFHNLSFIAGYNYSHGLDDQPGGNYHTTVPQNSLLPMLDYGASTFDIRHRFSLTPTYNIPGKKSPGQLLEGWVVNSGILIESGLPWNAVDSRDLSGTDELQDRWDFFGKPSDFTAGPNPIPFYSGGSPNMPAACLQAAASIGTTNTSLAKYGCFAQGNSVMIAPPLGQFGTMARNLFRGPGFADWDFSIFKNWTFKERFGAQFRAEFFNILNHPIYANPSSVGTTNPSGSTFGCACETPDTAATNPVLGSGAAREIQLGLKLLF